MSTKNLCRYSGLLGIAVIWFGVGWSMLRIGLSFLDSRPLSYLGVDPRTQTVFSTALIVSAILFICFGLYLRRLFGLHKWFVVVLVLGQVSQIVTALAPNKGSTKLLHTIAAFAIVFTLPPLIKIFAANQPVGPFRSLCYRLFWLEVFSFVVGIGLFTLVRGVAPLGEMLPAVAFHIWIIVLTQQRLSE